MEQKTCIVTGSGRGIGRACILAFAKEGYQVVVNYVSREPKELVETLKDMGATYLVVKADVSKEEEAKILVKETMAAFGSVDVLVNNAGITRDGLFMRMKEKDFREVLEVNLVSAFHVTKEVSAIMIKKRQGRIINMSSVVGLHGNAGQSNYAASKAGLIGLTKALAKELGKRHITVNAIAPGFIDTEMTKRLSEEVKEGLHERIALGTLGKPEDVAHVAVFLAKEESSYITGQVISVDGGMSL